jgi:iron complex outermembrane receptor protein
VDSVHYGKPGQIADYSGNKVIGVPDFTYATGITYSPSQLAGFRTSITVQGTTGYYADDANTVAVPGNTIVNLSLGMDRPIHLGGGLGLRGGISINNLFDTSYIGSAYLNPDVVAGQPVAFEPGLPRNVVVSVTLGWMSDR